jgi:amidase
LSWVHGNHTIKFGGEERRANTDNFSATPGTFTFPSITAFLADQATGFTTTPSNRSNRSYANALGLFVIGIPRAFFYDKTTPPGAKEPRGGLTPDQAKVMNDAVEILKQQGAIIVDPADIPSIVTTDPGRNFLQWNTCSGVTDSKGQDAGCSVVLKYGMKRNFNKWPASLGPSAPVASLTALREWNVTHTKAGAIKYGQSNLDVSDEMDLFADKARYEADRAKDLDLSATHGVDEVMKANRPDVLLFPGPSGAALAAKPGYPTVIVPFGFIPNAPPNAPFPETFHAKPAPFGVSFTGMSCAEPRLIGLAYAFEQATKRRVPPPLY